MPVEWRRATISDHRLTTLKALADPDQQDGDLLLVRPVSGNTEAYDPWEKRSEFFRLPKGDTDALLAFLRTVGYFVNDRLSEASDLTTAAAESTDGNVFFAKSDSKVSEKDIWGMRRLFENSVLMGGDAGEHSDFPVRIVTVKGQPRAVVTTTTFQDALALTLSIDAVLRAKRRKCARPDCGVPFTFTGGHSRKYCGWYCGHIESVRNSRKRAKKALTARRPSGGTGTAVLVPHKVKTAASVRK
jgi:hypothetical protein